MNSTLLSTQAVRNPVGRSGHCKHRGMVARASNADEDGFREMGKWLTSHGGYIHPSLTLGDSPTLGVRGVITTSSLSMDEVLESPLIQVPDHLWITDAMAPQKLDPLLKSFGLPSIQRLSKEMQVAMLLASEKSKGQHQESCEKFLRPARIQKETLYSEVDFALEEFGDALPIEAEDLLWSIAQVQSRAYSAGRTDEGVALTPVVDLLNHSGNAMPPVGTVMDDVETTCIGALDPLDIGDELFVNYTIAPDDHPFPYLLKFGFIPEEILYTSKDR